MLEINLDTSSLDRGLSQLLQNISHPRKMMKAIATEMTSLTEENFESESFGGNRWKQSQRAAQIVALRNEKGSYNTVSRYAV